MSEFDKEAEREKLREKFERDKEKRQETQRMSELLLKGATMTNRHCEECGDPIFRYDGQEFCPTCQQTAQQGGAEASAETAAASVESGVETTAESGAETEAGAGTQTSTDETTAEATQEGAENVRDETGSVERGTPVESVDSAAAGRPPEAAEQAADARSAVGDVGRGGAEAVAHEGDLTAARASLIRSVERYARAAEQAEDPRRAKDHLAASREAAEALRALDR